MALELDLIKCHRICGSCPTQNWLRFGQMSASTMQMGVRFHSMNNSRRFLMVQTCSRYGRATYQMTLGGTPKAAKFSTSPTLLPTQLSSRATLVIPVSSLSTSLCNKISVLTPDLKPTLIESITMIFGATEKFHTGLQT